MVLRGVVPVLFVGLLLAPAAAQSTRVDELIADLRAEQPNTRRRACRDLGDLGAEAAPAIPALIVRLSDRENDVRRAAIQCLGRIGQPAIAPLRQVFHDPDVRLRLSAANALGHVGQAALPALIEALEDSDPAVRLCGVRGLSECGSRAKPALAALGRATTDSFDKVRNTAVEALSKIGPAAVPILIACLEEHEVDEVRTLAARALGLIGYRARAAIPNLIAALSDPSPNVRGSAAKALGNVRAGAPAVAPLQGLLSDPEGDVRQQAALGLGLLGRLAVPAVPALTRALSDREPRVRGSSAKALGYVGPKAASAVPELSKVVRLDLQPSVRWAAATALGRIGPDAVDSVPALLLALESSDDALRQFAARALARLGPGAAFGLTNALSHDDADTRRYAATALGELGMSLKGNGTVLWWVVPLAHVRLLVVVGLFNVLLLRLAIRFPRWRPRSNAKYVALIGAVAALFCGLNCSVVHYAIGFEWAEGYLPDGLTWVPFPVAGVLSAGLVCVLVAVWICQHKPLAMPEETAADVSGA